MMSIDHHPKLKKVGENDLFFVFPYFLFLSYNSY